MEITMDQIVRLQHDSLNTLTLKLIYLIIQNRQGRSRWASISLAEFSKYLCITNKAIINNIDKLISMGLIEKRRDKKSKFEINKYRVLKV